MPVLRLLLPVLLLAPLGCRAVDVRGERVERAYFLETRGRWLEAGEVWQGLHRQDPGDAEAVRGLARALEVQGDRSGALAVLEGARGRTDGDALVRWELAVRYERAGRLESARDEYRAACDSDPAWAKPRIAAARLCMDVGDIREAHALVEQALQLAPEDVQARTLLARCLEAEGALGPALDVWLGLAASRGLDSSESLRAGRIALTEKRELETAEAWVSAARSRDPQRNDLHRLHAGILVELGRADEATEALRRALESDPGDMDVLEDLAGLYLSVGDSEAVGTLAAHARSVGDVELAARLERAVKEAREADPSRREADGG